jgi:hypothetical protein
MKATYCYLMNSQQTVNITPSWLFYYSTFPQTIYTVQISLECWRALELVGDPCIRRVTSAFQCLWPTSFDNVEQSIMLRSEFTGYSEARWWLVENNDAVSQLLLSMRLRHDWRSVMPVVTLGLHTRTLYATFGSVDAWPMEICLLYCKFTVPSFANYEGLGEADANAYSKWSFFCKLLLLEP